MVRPAIAILAVLVVVAAGQSAAAQGPSAVTERVSVASDGHQARGLSGRFTAPAISDDGIVVAFDAEGSNLVPDDDNGRVDVFWHDRSAGLTELVSVTPDGEQGNGDSQGQAVDAAGETVAFDSTASNFAPGDDNFTHDVFLRRMPAGTLELVSVALDGGVGDAESFDPSVTPTGRYVVFLSQASDLVRHDVNRSRDIFVRDMVTDTTELVNLNADGTLGNNFASSGSISDNARYVAWASFADNVVPGDANDSFDVFWRDRVTGEVQLVSRAIDGGFGDFPSTAPAISGDGRYVAFMSLAANLVPGDTNETTDVFVRDMATGTTERVNVGPGGAQANSASGTSVHGGSTVPTISDDGRYVSFESFAGNLVAGGDSNHHNDAFRRDRVLGETVLMSLSVTDRQANRDSSDTAMTADGSAMAFISLATNLVPRDTNRCGFFGDPGECPDIFVRDLTP